MKLLPIPGWPGYRVDCTNHVAYSMKTGVLKVIKGQKPNNEVSLYLNGKCTHLTLPRMEYCALNGINPDKLPNNICVVRGKNGEPILADRSEVSKKGINTKMVYGLSVEQLELLTAAVKAYETGDRIPYVTLVMKECERAKHYYVARHHNAAATVEEAVDSAVESILKKMDSGVTVADPFKFTVRTIYNYLRHLKKIKREYRDTMQPIEIEEGGEV